MPEKNKTYTVDLTNVVLEAARNAAQELGLKGTNDVDTELGIDITEDHRVLLVITAEPRE